MQIVEYIIEPNPSCKFMKIIGFLITFIKNQNCRFIIVIRLLIQIFFKNNTVAINIKGVIDKVDIFINEPILSKIFIFGENSKLSIIKFDTFCTYILIIYIYIYIIFINKI